MLKNLSVLLLESAIRTHPFAILSEENRTYPVQITAGMDAEMD